MVPSTKREKCIASKVDAKAKAIQEGTGSWDDNIVSEMRIAVPFDQLTEADLAFLCRYVAWRRQHPIPN